MNAKQNSEVTGGRQPLFRDEVLRARQQQCLGEILLARPLSFSFLCAFSLAAAIGIVLFLALGTYTRKERVIGQIVLSEGVAKLTSPVAGTVIKRLVEEGDTVTKGQPLYVISSERTSVSKGDAQAAIAQQMDARRISLHAELRKENLVLKEEDAALRRRIHDTGAELAQIESEITTQRARFDLNTQNLQRLRELEAQHFISQFELHNREQENLNQRAQLETLIRSRISLQKDIASLQAELRNAPLKASNQLAAIERSIAELEQQVVDNEVRRQFYVPTQVDAEVTAVLAEVGQNVGANTPLLSLLPKGGKFEAELFVPSRAVGFIQVGNLVQMRYQAFPYQKFGQYTGRIKEISHTALSPADLQLIGVTQESLYRMTVELASQNVIAYGQPMRLQDGMQLEADIQIDTRKLYEWVLEPLYSLSGKY